MLGQDSFLAIAKLCLAPALAGLRLALFRFDQSNHTDSVAHLESFRALKLTLLESFRALKS